MLSALGLAIVPFLFSCTASGLDGRLDKIEVTSDGTGNCHIQCK